jgi:sugar transferase (PEP-CTERM system associated)
MTLSKSLDLWINREGKSKEIPDPMIVGDFSQISSICAKNRVTRIVVALDEKRGKLPIEQLLICRLNGIQIDEGNAFRAKLSGKLSVESLHPSSLIYSNSLKGFLFKKKLKGFIDLCLSLSFASLLIPVGFVISLAIKLETRGPVFYSQKRVGKDGVIFDLLKFRSMRVDAEENGPIWACNNDNRITKVGRVIRKLHLDEIPQLINVLKGEMSFIGPRPERPFFVEMLQKEIPYYCFRHMVKPGITGWAQVYYHYGASKEDALKKLEYDLYYIKNMSLFLDLMVFFRTLRVVLWGNGAR